MNKILVPAKSFIFTIFFIGIGIITISANNLSYEEITGFSISLILCTLVILKQMTGELFSFSVIFLLFSYIMHLGHPFLIALGYDQVLGFDQRGYTTLTTYLSACQYCIETQFFLMLGMILGAKKIYNFRKSISSSTPSYIENSNYLHKTYLVGINLFFISLIPRLYVDLTKVLLYLQGGYLNTYNIDINGYVLVLAKMLDLSVLIIMVGSSNNKHRAQMWMLGMCLYHFLFMMTGNRGDAVMRVIVMLLVYSKLFPSKHMSVSKIMMLIISIWIGGAVLSSLGALRLAGMDLMQFVDEIIRRIFNEPAILKIFAEFGVTIKTVCFAYETFPDIQPFSYGFNYLIGSLAFLPNIGGFITRFINDMVFVYYFPNHSVIGGSYIGELYYAFGSLGCLFATLIGMFISKIDYIRIKSLCNNNLKMFLISTIFIAPFLWWIRDYYYTCVREIVMGGAFIYFLYKIQVVLKKYPK